MVRPKFERLSIGIVAFLSFVKMSYQIIDQKNVQIFANQMKQKPIAQFLSIRKGSWLKNGFDIRTPAWFATVDCDQTNPDLFSQKCCQSEDQKESSANGHKHQPKPDENERFLVYDVNG